MPPAYRIYSEVWGKTYIFLVFVLTIHTDSSLAKKVNNDGNSSSVRRAGRNMFEYFRMRQAGPERAEDCSMNLDTVTQLYNSLNECNPANCSSYYIASYY